MKELAEKLGIELLENLMELPLVQERKTIIPYVLAKQKKILPVETNDKEVTVAFSNLIDLEAIEELRLILRKSIRIIASPASAIESAIEWCYRQKEGEAGKIFSGSETKEEVATDIDNYDLLEEKEENPIIRMVNAILLEAIGQKASDVHFDPTEEGLFIRYRIDGVLHHRYNPPKGTEAQLSARIKVMAKMDVAEHRLPQDGRIKLHHGGREIDFRVSTLPIVYGERIVLRILDKGNVVYGLDQIGMDGTILKMMRKLIHMPEGIFLVTGPTGSGKTTTLYSAISEVHGVDVNIMTIEDPV